jgi:lipid II:glycine glycyltransferase (peptidoglycan interpeptide bridge formation enzyme)
MKFPNLQILKPEAINDLVLDEIIDNYGGTIFHDKKLNELVSKYYRTKFYYVVDDIVKPTIISPLHIENGAFIKKYNFWPSFDIPYGGFIGNYRYNLNFVNVKLYESFRYAGIPETNSIDTQNIIVAPGLAWQETCMIDLSDNLDTIFNHEINSKKRNKIRKAEKNGIEIKIYDTVEPSNDFFTLLNGLHKRLRYDFLKPEYYLDLLNYYIPRNKAKLLVAYKEDIPLSAVMLVANKNYVHYYKGCSANNVINEGQGELLQWEAIKWAKDIGAKYYDLCGLSKDRLPQLYIFKTGISRKIFYYPVYYKSGLLYKVINRAYKVFNLKI